MDTLHEQAEFVDNAILHCMVASKDCASRESRDHVDGAERRVVPLGDEHAEEVMVQRVQRCNSQVC